VELVALSHIKERFELAPKSHIAEEAVRRTSEALEAYEAEQGTERLKPGEMLIEHEGRPVKVPLLSPKWARRLAEGLSVTAVRRHLEYEQLQRLAEVFEDATLENLWHWVDQKELARSRSAKSGDFMPDEPLDAGSLGVIARRPGDITLPESVLLPVATSLAEDYGVKPALARAMAEAAAQVRQWCCPRVQELRPGQAVWLV
jgi:hypothetical protein